MYDHDPIVEIIPITSVLIRVGDRECTVSVDIWEAALEILDVIADYTDFVNVNKVRTIKMVRAACGSGLTEAKLMTEAYFEPRFNNFSERGWLEYS